MSAQTKSKKTTSSKSKTTKSKGTAKSVSHPPFADIIRACIADAGDRTGVSRSTIKKYIEEKYRMEVTPSVISNVNRSIAYGAEKGTFVLPKGPSGKVKLAPKRSSDAAKENKPTKLAAPAKKTAVSKPVVKPAKKTAAVAKKGTTMTKKNTPLTKKITKPAAASAKKASAKRAPAKKAMTGTAKAKPSAKAKTSAKKKTSTAAPSRRKSASTKPTSKAAVSAKSASPKK